MNRDEALEAVAELKKRIGSLLEAGPVANWSQESKILKNDVAEFRNDAFPAGSRDYSLLTRRPTIRGAMTSEWVVFQGFAIWLDEALGTVAHRLEKGQSEMPESGAGELVIDAGTPHTAYVKLREIVKTATTRVRLVDPYVGSDLFPLLGNVASGVDVEMLTWKSRTPSDFRSESAKFTSEHGIPVEIRWGTEDFHDRFLLADDRLYMSGGSFKDLGKKLTFVTEVESVRDMLKAELEKRWLAGKKA